MNKSYMTKDSYGTKVWWLYGRHHREDGPAIEYTDGRKEWFLNGTRSTEGQHAIFVRRQSFLVSTLEVI